MYFADDRLVLVRRWTCRRWPSWKIPPTGEWKAVRVDLKGPIRDGDAARIQKLIENNLRQYVNFVCLWIDTAGGSPEESVTLANFLAGVWIPARCGPSLHLLHCPIHCRHRRRGVRPDRQIPCAVLGGVGDDRMSDDEIEKFTAVIQNPSPGPRADPGR